MRRVLSVLALLPFLAACDEPGSPSRPPSDLSPPLGTMPLGSAEQRAQVAAPGPAPSATLLQRGRERYGIYCVPCHGGAGYGDGVVTRRGFPAPPSFHEPALREITPEHIVSVVTNGSGKMLSMAVQIPPQDRWAIAWYVKALQKSQDPGGRSP